MNGIYRAVYSVPGDRNEGLAFLDNGKIYGGDQSHVFHGKYTISGSQITASVSRLQYTKEGYPMGGGGHDISIVGTLEGNTLKGQGTIQGLPTKMDISMKLIAEIS